MVEWRIMKEKYRELIEPVLLWAICAYGKDYTWETSLTGIYHSISMANKDFNTLTTKSIQNRNSGIKNYRIGSFYAVSNSKLKSIFDEALDDIVDDGIIMHTEHILVKYSKGCYSAYHPATDKQVECILHVKELIADADKCDVCETNTKRVNEVLEVLYGFKMYESNRFSISSEAIENIINNKELLISEANESRLKLNKQIVKDLKAMIRKEYAKRYKDNRLYDDYVSTMTLLVDMLIKCK